MGWMAEIVNVHMMSMDEGVLTVQMIKLAQFLPERLGGVPVHLARNNL